MTKLNIGDEREYTCKGCREVCAEEINSINQSLLAPELCDDCADCCVERFENGEFDHD